MPPVAEGLGYAGHHPTEGRGGYIPHMSRFAIRDMGTTVAAGLCLDIEER